MLPPYTYQTLCKELSQRATIRTFSDFSYVAGAKAFEIEPKELQGKKTVMLRHDVDHYPELAYQMACTEAQLGIRSSYFILTTDVATKWWADKALRKKYLSLILDMQEMGHEIGLHYDFFGDYFSDGILPKTSIKNILTVFRDEGLRIYGAAAHGSKRMRVLLNTPGTVPYPEDFLNYKVWAESRVEAKELTVGARTLKIPALSLKEYDLHYETYLMTKDWYFSDSGGNFWLYGNGEHVFETLEKSNTPPYNMVSKMREGEVMQILAHPIWWKGNFQ